MALGPDSDGTVEDHAMTNFGVSLARFTDAIVIGWPRQVQCKLNFVPSGPAAASFTVPAAPAGR